ncbi:MAG: Recombination protein RecR [Chlamydiae bacterium]|nr:Recombination protein RecR [Chlamydiota bacterium]
MVKYPEHLIKLIETFRKFPGVGTKSAERFAFALLNFDEDVLQKMGTYIATTKQAISFCKTCGAMEIEKHCPFCANVKRDTTLLCVVSFAKDVFAIEDTHQYTGLYHVLGAQLSPIDDFEEKLNMQKLFGRLQKQEIKEVILALDSTLEGDATALFLKEELKHLDVHISRLAFGLPLGSSLDFVDGGTLSRAVQSRLQF